VAFLLFFLIAQSRKTGNAFYADLLRCWGHRVNNQMLLFCYTMELEMATGTNPLGFAVPNLYP
jgi:hypothetical protein